VAQSVGNKFTERSEEIHRERAGYQTKNYFRNVVIIEISLRWYKILMFRSSRTCCCIV